MSKTIIVYQSKYGATKKYAQWLAEELSCDLTETKKTTPIKLMEYDTIIFGGGIYASGIAGIAVLKKAYNRLKNKKIAVFAVGASPNDETAIKSVETHNLQGDLKDIPFFYLRGTWNEEKMSFIDRTLCGFLKNSVRKKNPADFEPWEETLMQAMDGKICDWTDKASLKPILKFAGYVK